MSNFSNLPERALELATQVGGNLKQAMPHAGKWLETGAKFGVVKSGARVAATFVRRNPAIAIATAAGAGLLWFAAYRHARKTENGNGDGRRAIEGSAKRVDAKRADGSRRGTRKTSTPRSRRSAAEAAES